jgi:GntR family transcriptional repressor for pyruvate dehydrogenase complex
VAKADTAPGIGVTRIRRASDQVSDQLRKLILSGALPPGTRLPSEQALTQQFGVSRATIREALNALSTEGLIQSKKGVKGGSFVTTPSADHVTDTLSFGVQLLSQTNHVTLDDLLEVRNFLEVPATGIAAERRSEEDIEVLRASLRPEEDPLSVGEQFVKNRSFHGTILAASRNTLLSIAAEPIFSLLQTRLARAALGPEFHQCIHDQHSQIADAIVAGDSAEGERLMADHLAWLRPHHERVWRRQPGNGSTQS